MTERPRTPYGDVEAAAARARETPPWLSPPPDRGPVDRIRHCWVLDEEHGRLPGLLLEWRQSDVGGWEGRVIAPKLIDEQWIPHESWLPAEILEPG